MLVAPALLRFTVVLVPVEVPVDDLVLVFERVTLVEFPVDVAPPLLTPVLRFEYPLFVRAVVEVVPFCFTLPVVTPAAPRVALELLVFVYVVPLAVVTLVRDDFFTATPPFVVMPLATTPPR